MCGHTASHQKGTQKQGHGASSLTPTKQETKDGSIDLGLSIDSRSMSLLLSEHTRGLPPFTAEKEVFRMNGKRQGLGVTKIMCCENVGCVPRIDQTRRRCSWFLVQAPWATPPDRQKSVIYAAKSCVPGANLKSSP